MRSLWLVAVGVALVCVGAVSAQPLPQPAAPASAPKASPTPLPPLLPPPAPPGPPLAEVPRPGCPPVEYDHGYLYLPERAPEVVVSDGCAPFGRWWAGAALELTWTPTRRAPAAVRLPAAGGAPGLVLPAAGRSAGSFGAGMSLGVGRWFDDANTRGLEANFFFREATRSFRGFAPGTIVLFDDGPGRSGPRLIVVPDPDLSRALSSFPATFSTFFTTVDVNYRHALFCNPHARLDALAGYRFAYLSDELYLGRVSDGGDDHNRASVSTPFHGGQVGLAGEVRGGGWYASGSAKVAFGAVSPEATTSGLFSGAEGGSSRDGFSRLRALTDSGESRFAVMPTLNVALGRQLTDHARLFVGYSFYYLSRAARLGDALDPGADRLALTDFWVQSVNLGFELRY